MKTIIGCPMPRSPPTQNALNTLSVGVHHISSALWVTGQDDTRQQTTVSARLTLHHRSASPNDDRDVYIIQLSTINLIMKTSLSYQQSKITCTVTLLLSNGKFN